MPSLYSKVKDKLTSNSENGERLSRTNSLRSSLSHTLSRKDKRRSSGGENRLDRKGTDSRPDSELALSPDFRPQKVESAADDATAADTTADEAPNDVGTKEPHEAGKQTAIPPERAETEALAPITTGNAVVDEGSLRHTQKSQQNGSIGQSKSSQEFNHEVSENERIKKYKDSLMEHTTNETHDLQAPIVATTLSDPSAQLDGTTAPEVSSQIKIAPHLIQASSTPLQESQGAYLNDSDSHDSINSDLPPSEHSPLLSNSVAGYTDLENWGGRDDGETFHNRNSVLGQIYDYLFRKNPWSTFSIVFLLVVLCVITVSTISQIETLLNQAVLPDLQSVSVLDVTDSGMSVHVIGSIYVEYEQISNYFYRNTLKLAGLLIGGVTVVPKRECLVFVSTNGLPNKHVLDIFPPELSVDLIDRRITEIDFISEAEFMQHEIIEFARSLTLINRLEPLPLDIEVVVDSRIISKFFHYNTQPMSIYQHIELLPGDMEIPIQIDDLDVNMGKSSVSLEVVASTVKVLPLKFEINSIEWDIALPNCQKEPKILGEWISDAVEFLPNERTVFLVHGNVKEVPKPILEVCLDGLSPFNKFTNKLIGENTLSVLAKVRKSRANEEALPPWLYNILSSTFYPLDTPVPISDIDYSNLVLNYTVDGVSIVVPNKKWGLSAQMAANMTVDLQLPFKATNINASISEVVATLDILDDSDETLEVMIEGNNQFDLHYPDNSLNGTVTINASNVELQVLSPEEVGCLLNDILNNLNVDVPLWNLNLELALLNLPIVSTTIRHLKLTHRNIKSNSINNDGEDYLDWLIRAIDLRIDEILYVNSNKTHIDLLVDFKVTNPFNFLLRVPDDILRFDYFYNGTSIGTVAIRDVSILSGAKDYDMSVWMSISCQDTKQRIFAEEFISKVISAADGTRLSVSGHRPASKNNPFLSTLLEQIKLDELRVPVIRFGGDNDDDDDAVGRRSDDSEDGQPRKSPFLIDATIHVLTSEIEITVFNPLANVEIMAEILKCQASYKGEMLAYIDRSELMLIPPGIYKSPRIPIKISQGIGSDILRRAMNGNLFVEVTADLGVRIDKFSMQLLYHGSGLSATVKL